jgi:hypothetical protein
MLVKCPMCAKFRARHCTRPWDKSKYKGNNKYSWGKCFSKKRIRHFREFQLNLGIIELMNLMLAN